ncbi:MAG: DUF1801 domain-containing protein [Candidatus Nanopelagicales bacterium]|jgi:uncharacterized protein YdhG (YjbR/CyaY superfamily)|nr:DUF1801 domain-containing protein [Candidatus Nanopelagicales bacterium]
MSGTQEGFSAEERAAMKARAAEVRGTSQRGSGAKRAEADAQACRAAIAEMDGTDRAVAQALHAIVTSTVPDLAPRTWYGMPAYARDGKVLVFCKPAGKFKVRYAEVGFNEFAMLDDGVMWPTAFAVTAVTPEVEAKLTELVRRAAS